MEPSKISAKCSVVVSTDILYVWEDVIEDVFVLDANVLVDVNVDVSKNFVCCRNKHSICLVQSYSRRHRKRSDCGCRRCGRCYC